jgi:hypothetical protein
MLRTTERSARRRIGLVHPRLHHDVVVDLVAKAGNRGGHAVGVIGRADVELGGFSGLVLKALPVAALSLLAEISSQ